MRPSDGTFHFGGGKLWAEVCTSGGWAGGPFLPMPCGGGGVMLQRLLYPQVPAQRTLAGTGQGKLIPCKCTCYFCEGVLSTALTLCDYK